MKTKRTKNSKIPENLPKFVHTNYQIWFPKFKFENSNLTSQMNDVQQKIRSESQNCHRCLILKFYGILYHCVTAYSRRSTTLVSVLYDISSKLWKSRH